MYFKKQMLLVVLLASITTVKSHAMLTTVATAAVYGVGSAAIVASPTYFAKEDVDKKVGRVTMALGAGGVLGALSGCLYLLPFVAITSPLPCAVAAVAGCCAGGAALIGSINKGRGIFPA